MIKHLVIVCAIALFSLGNVCALPLSTLENSYSFLARKTAVCMWAAPTQANPIRGSALIAELREQGRLLDAFKCGRCRYDLVGEAGAAYYIKSCGALTLD
jgi:hypothetical protein